MNTGGAARAKRLSLGGTAGQTKQRPAENPQKHEDQNHKNLQVVSVEGGRHFSSLRLADLTDVSTVRSARVARYEPRTLSTETEKEAARAARMSRNIEPGVRRRRYLGAGLEIWSS